MGPMALTVMTACSRVSTMGKLIAVGVAYHAVRTGKTARVLTNRIFRMIAWRIVATPVILIILRVGVTDLTNAIIGRVALSIVPRILRTIKHHFQASAARRRIGWIPGDALRYEGGVASPSMHVMAVFTIVPIVIVCQ